MRGLVAGTAATALLISISGAARAGDLAAAVAASGPGRGWVAWSVPGTERAARTCCWSGDWRRVGCALAGGEENRGSSDRWRPAGAPQVLHVFAAIEKGVPVRLLAVGAACPVEVAGERLVELGDVPATESLALLERWSRGAARDGVRQAALAALADHRAPAAAARLAAIGRDGASRELRSQALFWLAQTADPRAGAWIRAAIGDDPDPEAREQAVFALSQLDDATPELVALLHEAREARVRRQALFWLARSNDPRALAELDRILNPDGRPGGAQP